MKVVCSACSHEHDVSPAELSLGSSCVRCGQNLGKGTLNLGAQVELGGQVNLAGKAGAAHSYSIPSRARDDLRAATKDLFGSIEPPKPSAPALPVRPPQPEPPAPAVTSNENSIMFSLESLMKARGAGTPSAPQVEQVSEQHLWDMTGAPPLFGTAQDQALLTTPLHQPTPPVHVMTLPSRPPRRRGRWKWIASGVGVCGMAFAGWGLLNARSTVQATVPSGEPAIAQASAAALVAQEAKPEPAAPAEAKVVPAVAQGQAIDPNAAQSAAGSADPAGTADPAAAATAEQPAAVAGDSPAPSAEASVAPAPSTAPGDSNAVADSSKTATGKKSPRNTNAKKVASADSAAAKAKGVGLPFNVGAAKDALTSASSKAAACGKSGPGGTGKVQVTFAPNGRVSSAGLTSGSFSGSTQTCVLRAFRAARVPAFAGNAVTVAKSFKL